MTATHTEDRLACVFDYFKHSRQRLRRVFVPGVTLTAEDYVRRAQAADPLQRYAVKRLSKDLKTGNQTTQHRANLAWAGALSIDCVVDQVNEQGYFKQ